ncbi:hypothetical protein [Burkholderia sp. AU6039]|nr:hypothetical protein [Burkholderia sp. AU6039]
MSPVTRLLLEKALFGPRLVDQVRQAADTLPEPQYCRGNERDASSG